MRRIYLYSGLYIDFIGSLSLKYFALRNQLKLYKQQAEKSVAKFPITELQAHYEDKKDNAGELDYHYFWQDLFVAQRIALNCPEKHIDIGSRIGGFVAHVASFRKIEVFDIRPLEIDIDNITFRQVDLMQLNTEFINYTDSISCLHALEHFGLGRYGDSIDFEGYLKGFENIGKMLKTGGKFYFSVPLGTQCTVFHAHRIFSLRYLLDMIEPNYRIDAFSFVDDQNIFHKKVEINNKIITDNAGCNFGCAIFELTKK
jgi:SAM-dependent methyltransferase